MKIYFILLFLFLSVNVWAQTISVGENDTIKAVRGLASTVNPNTLFIIDGQPSKNKLNDIKPNDIFSIDILKKGKGSDGTMEPINDVVVVTTEAYAVKIYQKKFSTFSKNYKNYIETHQNSDDEFLYVVDGIPVQGKRNGITRTLYAIPPEKIKEVGFSKKQPTDGSKKQVIINTKQ